MIHIGQAHNVILQAVMKLDIYKSVRHGAMIHIGQCYIQCKYSVNYNGTSTCMLSDYS